MPEPFKPFPDLPKLIVDDSLTREEIEQLVVRLEREKRALLVRNEEMHQQATHDVLTGLPNRLLFEDRAEAAIRRALRSHRSLALAFTDLDGFKAINDRHGHAAGDELLRIVAQRLAGALRATDTVARLGGDEFGLLLEMLDAPATAALLGEKLHHALVQPVTLQADAEGRPVQLAAGASIGIAIFPDHAAKLPDLLSLADGAMYEAKRAGGGVRVYSGERRQRGESTVKPLRERRGQRGRSPAEDGEAVVKTKH